MKMSFKQDNNSTIDYILLIIYFFIILLLELNMDNAVDAFIKYKHNKRNVLDLSSIERIVYEQNM